MRFNVTHGLKVFNRCLQRRVDPPVGEIQEKGPVLIVLNNLNRFIRPLIGQIAARRKTVFAAIVKGSLES